MNAPEFSCLVGCRHYVNARQVPCPPMCPVQQWPRHLFRPTWFRGRPKLRRRYRHLLPAAHDQAATVVADKES